jgi:hypothetical protein
MKKLTYKKDAFLGAVNSTPSDNWRIRSALKELLVEMVEKIERLDLEKVGLEERIKRLEDLQPFGSWNFL